MGICLCLKSNLVFLCLQNKWLTWSKEVLILKEIDLVSNFDTPNECGKFLTNVSACWLVMLWSDLTTLNIFCVKVLFLQRPLIFQWIFSYPSVNVARLGDVQYQIRPATTLPQGVVMATPASLHTQTQLAEEASRKRELRLMKNRWVKDIPKHLHFTKVAVNSGKLPLL